MEIGADSFSLIRAMYMGHIVSNRLYLKKKGNYEEFEIAVERIKIILEIEDPMLA